MEDFHSIFCSKFQYHLLKVNEHAIECFHQLGLFIVWWAWGTPVKGPFSQWCSLKGMVTETCDSHERGFKSGKAINEEREKESKKVLIEDSIEVSSHNIS